MKHIAHSLFGKIISIHLKAKFEAPKHHAEIFSGRKSINDVNNVSILVFDLSILFYTATHSGVEPSTSAKAFLQGGPKTSNF